MGQYYKPINLDSGQWLYTHDYETGMKLMEHSWIGNEFVGRVMELLTKGGDWYKQRIAWAGDYYSEEGETNHYDLVKDENKIKPTNFLTEKEQEDSILVNHDKKQYVIMSKAPIDTDGWRANPLPLLTALGNGRGGGDYNGVNEDKVGIWAEDVLSVETEIPEGFEELEIKFLEGDEDTPETKKAREEAEEKAKNTFYLTKDSDFYNPLFARIDRGDQRYELKNIIFFKDGEEFMQTGRGWFDNKNYPEEINLKLVRKNKVDFSLDHAFITPVKKDSYEHKKGRKANLYLPLDKFNFKKVKQYTTKYGDTDVLYYVFEDKDLGVSISKKIKETARPERPVENEISDFNKDIKELEKKKAKAEKKLQKLNN